MLKKQTFLIALVLLLTPLSFSLSPTNAASIPDNSYLELAEKFAPVLYFHPDEVFRPQPVEVILGTSRLRENIKNWFDHNILNSVTISDLVTYKDADFFIDVWYGTRGESDYKNFSSHRAYYLENLSPDSGGPPNAVYARVLEDHTTQKLVLQYWLFYYYNDWFNKHEGDWELVEVILNDDQTPEWVILSQHHGGTRRTWQTTKIESRTHPAVYVALGSHANYFWGDEIYPNGMDIGNSRVEILDRTGTTGKIIPQVILLPDTLDIPLTEKEDWLGFLGNWGETAYQSDFGGPTGPSAKGQQWEDPYQWGLAQPLDMEIWYQNRLQIISENTTNAVILPSKTPLLSASDIDTASNTFILHADPPAAENLHFTVQAEFQPESSIQFYWPEAEGQTVTQYTFSNLNLNAAQQIEILKPAGKPPQITTQTGETILPSTGSTNTQTWDQPDLVWFAGYLTTNQVLEGILISLAAGILPALAYIFLIYNFDKNEKEPKSLIAAALGWGAVPAVLVALAANLFFNLPPSLIGPEAVEAVKIGIFSPLVEELLKGAIVLFFALKRKKEFNNTLDGIIYGSMVGLGFAMTGNTISYLGSFLYRGFDSLRLSILFEGLFFGLNHAFYTAIFGAGLGYARQFTKKSTRTAIPLIAFVLAVLVNGIHSYITQALVGVTPLTIILNWLAISAIFVIMIISIRRENNILNQFLADELPHPLFDAATKYKKRRTLLRQIKKIEGRDAAKKAAQFFKQTAQLAFLKEEIERNPAADPLNQVEVLREQIQAAVEKIAQILEEMNISETDGR